MSVITLFFLGFFLVIVQTTLLGHLGPIAFKAPLIVVMVFYAAFHMEPVRALTLSFLLGYTMDVFSGGVQGTCAIVMVILCLLGQWLSRGMVVERWGAVMAAVFLFGVIHSVLWFGVETFLGTLSSGIDLSAILISAAFLSITGPVLVKTARQLDRLTARSLKRFPGLRA